MQPEAKSIAKHFSFVLKRTHEVIKPLHGFVVDFQVMNREFNIGNSKYMPDPDNPLVAILNYLNDLQSLRIPDVELVSLKNGKIQVPENKEEHLQKIIEAGRLFIGASVRIFQDVVVLLTHQCDNFYLSSTLEQLNNLPEIKEVVDSCWLTESLVEFFNMFQVNIYVELKTITCALMRTLRTFHDIGTLESAQEELLLLSFSDNIDDSKRLMSSMIVEEKIEQPAYFLEVRASNNGKKKGNGIDLTNLTSSSSSSSSSISNGLKRKLNGANGSSDSITSHEEKVSETIKRLKSNSEQVSNIRNEEQVVPSSSLAKTQIFQAKQSLFEDGELPSSNESESSTDSSLILVHAPKSRFEIEMKLLGGKVWETPVLNSKAFIKAHNNKLCELPEVILAFQYIDEGNELMQRVLDEIMNSPKLVDEISTSNSASNIFDSFNEKQRQHIYLAHTYRKKGNDILSSHKLL